MNSTRTQPVIRGASEASPARRRTPAAFLGRRLPVALAIAGLAASLAGPADAVVVTWTGAGANNNWSTSANWASGVRPATGDSLLFQGSSRLVNQNNYTSDLSLSGISFGASAGAFTLNGGSFTSNGNITNASSNVQTFNLGVRVGVPGSSQTWDGGSQGMVFNGAVLLGADSSLNLVNRVSITGLTDWTVAAEGTATVSVASGSTVRTGNLVVANGGDSVGTVTVSGVGSAWTVNTGVGLGGLVVGRDGTAQVNVLNGAAMTADSAHIAVGGGSGALYVSGAGSSFTARVLEVGNTGYGGPGTLTIDGGAQVNTAHPSALESDVGDWGGRVGVYEGGSGTASVSGAGSRWTSSLLEVGIEGNGTLSVAQGGAVVSGPVWIGGSPAAAGNTGVGLVTVDGIGSSFSSSGNLVIGYFGSGRLNVTDGGRVDTARSAIGDRPGSVGTAVVSGAQSVWANSERLDIGGQGVGSLTVLAGGTVSTGFGIIGRDTSGAALASSVLVSGAGSSWASSADVFVTNGSLRVEDGAVATMNSAFVGLNDEDGGEGSITVQGAGSKLTAADTFEMGVGTLAITDGGQVSSDKATVGSRSRVAQVSVSGAQSVWANSGDLNVGGVGIGNMTVTAGGAVQNVWGYIGRDSTGAAAASSVVVTGAGSRWDSSIGVYVSNGSLLIDDGGVASMNEARVGRYGGSSGSITVQGAGSQLLVAGTIRLADSAADSLGGKLTVLAGGSASTSAIVIGAPGSLALDGGTLNLGHSADSTNAGSFSWTGGTLHFSGNGSFADGTLLRNNTTLSTGMTLAVDGMLNLSDATVLTLNGGQLQGGTINLSGLATVGAGSTITAATRLSNFASLQLAGGTLSGPGILYNTAEMTGYGRIDGSGGYTNSGLLTQAGGDLVLSNTGQNANLGTWNGLAGRQLVLSGTDLSNAGQINLNGGFIVGNGGLVNTAQGTVSGNGRIDTVFFNQGTLVVDAGLTAITQSFVNRGQIFLGANSATLAGGQIGNHGLIQGLGKISSNISNIDPIGVIEAQGGTLTLSGLIVSPNGGTLAASSGAKLLVTQGLASNAGQIQLAGGTFDNNNKALMNASNGVISGYGTLRTGGLTQNGQIQFSGGAAVPTSVYGSVLANAGSKTILSGNSNATFYGAVDVQSGAELRVSSGSVATFFGLVQQRSGALFTGSGSKRFEGGLSVGASPGLGTDEGDVEFGDGNVYLAEIGGITACTLACGTDEAVRNSSYDKYIVGGQLSLGGTLKLVSWNGFVAQAGQQFDLLDWGTVAGSFASVDASGFTLAAGTTLDFSQLGSTGTISVTAVPEPGSLALLLAGLLAVGRIVSRRAKADGELRP